MTHADNQPYENLRRQFADVEGSMSEELMAERRAEAAQSAESVRTLTTYKRADGELFTSDVGWYTDEEACHNEVDNEAADYLEFIEETWQLVSRRTFALGSLERWCQECDADVTLAEPVKGPVFCPEHIDGEV